MKDEGYRDYVWSGIVGDGGDMVGHPDDSDMVCTSDGGDNSVVGGGDKSAADSGDKVDDVIRTMIWIVQVMILLIWYMIKMMMVI